jgi:hypothetical protein
MDQFAGKLRGSKDKDLPVIAFETGKNHSPQYFRSRIDNPDSSGTSRVTHFSGDSPASSFPVDVIVFYCYSNPAGRRKGGELSNFRILAEMTHTIFTFPTIINPSHILFIRSNFSSQIVINRLKSPVISVLKQGIRFP